MTTLQKLITDLKSNGWETISVEMLEKNILEPYFILERHSILNAFNAGEYIAMSKERLDFDSSDFDYLDEYKYYEHIKNIPC